MTKSKTIAEPKTYSRDKRSPTPKSAVVSGVMSAIKAKNTKPELALRQLLWSNDVRGYRLNWKNAPGRPDIAFPGRKLAIFVHGCFWHRCPICAKPNPKHNSEFWQNKFDKNVSRDQMKTTQLQDLGWTVITVWECQLKDEPGKIVENILQELKVKV